MRRAILILGCIFPAIGQGFGADMGDLPFRNWYDASRAFYQGEDDPIYKLYLDGRRWVLGEVIESPIDQRSQMAGLIRLHVVYPDPLVSMRAISTAIPDVILYYCKDHQLLSLRDSVKKLTEGKER